MTLKTRYIILSVLCLLFASSCDKKNWDDYNAIQNPALSENLLTAINKNPELSQFASYLSKTGYDKVIASSKSFTIWVPTNAALQKVEPAILSNDASLKQFIGNHISNQTYLTSNVETFLYIKTLNGKNVTFTKTTVDEQPISKADQYVANGVMHVISDAIIPKLSAWEYLMSTNFLQKQQLESLNYTFFDKITAEQIGIDPNTGKPIYKPGTGVLHLNRFTDLAAINNEDSLYTYVVLTDVAYNAEKTKLAKYFQTGVQEVTDSLTNFSVIKSLSFKGVLNADNFPDTVYSTVDSVKFHLRKDDIAETHRVSNGIVYVMSGIDYKLLAQNNDSYTKIKPIIIQGEKLDSMLSVKSPNIRLRRNPDNSLFRDIILENHGVSSFWFNYRTGANSTEYKVYWRVVRDYSLTLSGTATDLTYFPLSLSFQTPSPLTFTKPKPGVIDNGINPATGKRTFSPDYSEVYLGNYTSPKYYSGNKLEPNGAGMLNIYLVGNASTTNGANTLLLDYIKLIPAL